MTDHEHHRDAASNQASDEVPEGAREHCTYACRIDGRAGYLRLYDDRLDLIYAGRRLGKLRVPESIPVVSISHVYTGQPGRLFCSLRLVAGGREIELKLPNLDAAMVSDTLAMVMDEHRLEDAPAASAVSWAAAGEPESLLAPPEPLPTPPSAGPIDRGPARAEATTEQGAAPRPAPREPIVTGGYLNPAAFSSALPPSAVPPPPPRTPTLAPVPTASFAAAAPEATESDVAGPEATGPDATEEVGRAGDGRPADEAGGKVEAGGQAVEVAEQADALRGLLGAVQRASEHQPGPGGPAEIASPSAGGGDADVAGRSEGLRMLFDAGVISEEEYRAGRMDPGAGVRTP